MPIIAKDNRKEYEPAPEGLHQAVCVDVVDLGLIETQWGLKRTIRIHWQLESTYFDEADKKSKRFTVVNRYNLSLNEKANLRKHLEAWRGKKFTGDELKGFDLERLIGVNCQLQIVHDISDNGRTYANVQAIVPLGKGMTPIQSEDYTRAKDRVEENTDEAVPPPDDDDTPF